MQHVGTTIADLMRRNEDRAERDRQRRQENHERYGWPVDAECVDCGDTGMNATGAFCWCETGNRLTAAKAHEDSWHAFVPRRFAGYRLATAPNQDAAAAVAAWIEAEPWRKGRNLIISGPVGTGKTGLAIGAMRCVYDRYPVVPRFIGVPSLLDALRPDGGATVETYVRERVLILDDLGTEKASEWARERLYLLINGRYESQRSTIVTTNCGFDKLAEAIGERTVSRLQEDATIVPLGGRDERRS